MNDEPDLLDAWGVNRSANGQIEPRYNYRRVDARSTKAKRVGHVASNVRGFNRIPIQVCAGARRVSKEGSFTQGKFPTRVPSECRGLARVSKIPNLHMPAGFLSRAPDRDGGTGAASYSNICVQDERPLGNNFGLIIDYIC